MADLNRMDRTWLCSVVFTDIVMYSSHSVELQMKWKARFNRYLTDAIRDVPEHERVILDTGDGAAICFLAAPEAAMFAALELQQSFMRDQREQQPGLRVRIGINLGPVKLVKDINGALNAIGDGINAGQRIMNFAAENQIMVSQSFFEVVSRLSDDYKVLFKLRGVKTDKHVREYTVYDLSPPGSDSAEISDQTAEELARDLAAVRAAEKTAGLTSASPPKTVQPHESEVTHLDTRPQIVLPVQPAPAPQRAVASSVRPGRKRSKNGYVLLGAAAVIVAAGGWYFLRKDKGPAKELPAAAAVSAGPSASATAITDAPPVASEPAAAAVSPSPPASATASSDTPPITSEPVAPSARPPPAATVDFDPKSLDPKENAKLIIDAELMPAGLDFTVEMNGKIYFRRSAEGNKAKYENLYVPPGVQEFHVTARNADVQRGSNTVRTEFKAKKRKTLKVELRSQGQGEEKGVPQDLYPNAKLVATLK